MLDASLPSATDNINAAAQSNTIDPSQATVLSRASYLLNYGNVEIDFTGTLDNGLAAGDTKVVNGQGFIRVDASLDQYFNSDGSVNYNVLEGTLVHEATHVSDELSWGHGPQSLDQVRQTERNAFSAEADFYQAVGSNGSEPPHFFSALTLSGQQVALPLTPGNVNFIAEYDVMGEYPRIYGGLLSAYNNTNSNNSQIISRYNGYLAAVNQRNSGLPASQQQIPVPRPPLAPVPPMPGPYAPPNN